MPPCPVTRSTSSRMRCLSSALNLRRWAFAATSGTGELARKGTAGLVSLTMILLAALLCNYGRGKCLIIIGTEGITIEAIIKVVAEHFSMQPAQLKQKSNAHQIAYPRQIAMYLV